MKEGRLLVLGDDDDARAFRLAGVEALVCRTERDVTQAIDLASAGRTPVALLLVSEPVARLGRAALDRLEASADWPIVFVLPPRAESGAP